MHGVPEVNEELLRELGLRCAACQHTPAEHCDHDDDPCGGLHKECTCPKFERPEGS